MFGSSESNPNLNRVIPTTINFIISWILNLISLSAFVLGLDHSTIVGLGIEIGVLSIYVP